MSINTSARTFAELFGAEIECNGENIILKDIVIPNIQRDYAQGRESEEVTRVRNRFLEALFSAVTDKPITLDFIYGDIKGGIFIPLDGQQRLTTLFLLHLYAAKKENIPESECEFLNNFSYDTRPSARDFCKHAVKDFNPVFGGEEKLSEQIEDSAWFPLSWKRDPTISSMLVMLDAIDGYFGKADGIWNSLIRERKITFYTLAIGKMGLTDELYIKMNSRGKPLTQFEHFKAELEARLKAADTDIAQRIIGKTDREWTDLLWQYREENENNIIIDDKFLRYFRFVCDIIHYKTEAAESGTEGGDAFDLLDRYFPADNKKMTEQNIKTVESFFDCLLKPAGYDNPKAFAEAFMSREHGAEMITVDPAYDIDIFMDCINGYGSKSGAKRQFPLNRTVLLYAITVYLRNYDNISESDFRRRLRIVNNLIRNSQDEIVDRTKNNRIPAILKAVYSVICDGVIKEQDEIGINFNQNQVEEETEKLRMTEAHPSRAKELFALEDHGLLSGQIGIVGTENLSLRTNFESLFKCDLDKADCALMAMGDYGQQEKNGNPYQYASPNYSAWFDLFHKSANKGFDNTSKCLIKLLKKASCFDNGTLDGIAKDYLSECEAKSEFPLQYYYIKYKVFRPEKYGKMSKTKNEAYTVYIMQTQSRWSTTTYSPYLKEAENRGFGKLPERDYGTFLIFKDLRITCENAAYVLGDSDGNELERIPVPQNESGIDTKNRIELLIEYLNEKDTAKAL